MPFHLPKLRRPPYTGQSGDTVNLLWEMTNLVWDMTNLFWDVTHLFWDVTNLFGDQTVWGEYVQPCNRFTHDYNA